MIEALTKAKRKGRLVDKLRFFARASLLIVDEIGYLPIPPGGAKVRAFDARRAIGRYLRFE